MAMIQPNRIFNRENQFAGYVDELFDRRRWRQVERQLDNIRTNGATVDGETGAQRADDYTVRFAVKLREWATQMDTYRETQDEADDDTALTAVEGLISTYGIGSVGRALQKKAPRGKITDELRIVKRARRRQRD